MTSVGQRAAEVRAAFGERTLELLVPGATGPLLFAIGDVAPLNEAIVPAESKVIIKADKVTLSLLKKDPAKHWFQLRRDRSTINV